MTHERDEWLMLHAALGDQRCLEPLVRRYASPLLTFIRRMIGDGHRSAELFQDVFVAVWTRRKQYEFPRPFRAWLYAIAVNVCRAEFRRRRGVSYQIDLWYHVPGSELPLADGPLTIDIAYDRTELHVGDSVTATTTVINHMPQAAPMVILDLPVPPGFVADADDFAALMTNQTIAKYQLTPRSVIVYLRELGAGKSLQLRYRLQASMPVRVTSPPAKAYEYYDPQKQVAEPHG